MEEIEIIRFVEPVDFSVELEKKAAIALAVGLIGATISIGSMLIENRLKARAAKKLFAEIEEMKNQAKEEA